MNSPKKKFRASRVTIEVKVDKDACRAAKAAFAECHLTLNTAIELFICQTARRFYASQQVDEAHDVFASIDDLMEYLEEREAGRAPVRVPGIPPREEPKKGRKSEKTKAGKKEEKKAKKDDKPAKDKKTGKSADRPKKA